MSGNPCRGRRSRGGWCIGTAAGAVLLVLATAGQVSAQTPGLQSPWSFRGTDRASMAVIMRQVEGGMYDTRSQRGSAASTSSSSGGISQYICGGGTSSASATGNSVCVIVGNNSSGSVGSDQLLGGSASASSSVNDMIQQIAPADGQE